MKTIEDIKNQLTEGEFLMLALIVHEYNPKDVVCYTSRLTPSQKGTIGSLVKKDMVYDSYAGFGNDDPDHQEGNWFPSYDVVKAFGLPEHWPY
jgi:hypothetical protein